MKTTSLELFFFDHCEGVHQNLLQRLKPRCLFEIELRPSWGQRFSTLIDPIGPVEVNTERLVPGKPHRLTRALFERLKGQTSCLQALEALLTRAANHSAHIA